MKTVLYGSSNSLIVVKDTNGSFIKRVEYRDDGSIDNCHYDGKKSIINNEPFSISYNNTMINRIHYCNLANYHNNVYWRYKTILFNNLKVTAVLYFDFDGKSNNILYGVFNEKDYNKYIKLKSIS